MVRNFGADWLPARTGRVNRFTRRVGCDISSQHTIVVHGEVHQEELSEIRCQAAADYVDELSRREHLRKGARGEIENGLSIHGTRG
jgi:hypothetical protein